MTGGQAIEEDLARLAFGDVKNRQFRLRYAHQNSAPKIETRIGELGNLIERGEHDRVGLLWVRRWMFRQIEIRRIAPLAKRQPIQFLGVQMFRFSGWVRISVGD